jgi:hypothetical protein
MVQACSIYRLFVVFASENKPRFSFLQVFLIPLKQYFLNDFKELGNESIAPKEYQSEALTLLMVLK